MAAGHDEDAALMLRVQRGDLAAFEILVENYRQPVFNFVQRTIRNLDDTDDLAQQVFIQAWKAADRYRATARFSTWLFTIARNLCLNELRRRGRHPTEPLDAPLETEDGPRPRELPGSDPAPVTGDVLLGELEARIEEALADLLEVQRSAILLFRDQDLPYDEIARILGVSVSATKSLIHRGRETLKLRLKAYLRSGAWEPASKPAATFPRTRV